MRKLYTFLLLVTIIFQISKASAQDMQKFKYLSAVKVDNLNEGDIDKIKIQLQNSNMTLEQAEPLIVKEIGVSEFNKLKIRFGSNVPKAINSNSDSSSSSIGISERKQVGIYNNKLKDPVNISIFGSDFFDNPDLNFEPNLKLATPLNYILGPGDELQVSVYGIQEYSDIIPVTVEGKVIIQHVGQIQVSGMTIEAVTQKITSALAKVYSTVRSGQSKVSINLSTIRTIKITIIGSKQPGNYSVSSLATVYNALHLAGGPGSNGSYRNIELIRNNKVFKNIDIYRFLVSGSQADNVGLKDNDVIRIPSYTHRVTIDGQVKRPGIFELKNGESFGDLLSFASGFNESAYTASVKVLQKTAKEYKVKDINSNEFTSYYPQPNDVFTVTKILNRFENRVKIMGTVFRPDNYSLIKGMRISDLISQAEGLKEDAYQKRARIVRLKPDLTTEIISVNLTKALEGDKEANILLNREDEITIYSILDFQDDFKITIDGEIKNPGTYKYHELLSLNDLLIEAGGLTGSASKRVEIARMIKSDEIDDTNPSKVTLFNLEISANNNEQVKNFVLEPFDVINIRRMGMYEKPEMVTITGAVAYPGKYVLANKTEKNI